MNDIEWQEKVVKEIVASVSQDWDLIKVHYEHYVHNNGDNYRFEQCFVYLNGVKDQFFMKFQTYNLFHIAHTHILKTGNEPWTSFDLEIEVDGKFKFEFRYDLPPMTEDQLKHAGLL